MAEAQGLLEPQDLQTWRLLYAPGAYTRERFQGYLPVDARLSRPGRPGATYEEVVDNRAWQ